MSLELKFRRAGRKPPSEENEEWMKIRDKLQEFEDKMREAETDPHEESTTSAPATSTICTDTKKSPRNYTSCYCRCVQTRDTNFGTNCICRVPKAKLDVDRVIECVHCGCRGCSG
ncbi:hypothetical protein WR25_13367 [Diploscapter pachys]|uniref:Protein BUD31 homolog n=1 Tax=Diploscapter pachys TaxID=2018661 RepID=A0A2A2J2R7_9BILA|nr:hypothetical protein WR25_13367 [Diploscapter pachys]